MLPELHQSLQDLIYREGRIDRSDVDIAFEVPTKDFIDRLVRPTVDLYLVELQENVELRQPQFKTTPHNGATRFEAVPRRLHVMSWHSAGTLADIPLLAPWADTLSKSVAAIAIALYVCRLRSRQPFLMMSWNFHFHLLFSERLCANRSLYRRTFSERKRG